MRPITAWLADDLTLFLPLDPKGVIAYHGGEQASKACYDYEEKLKNDM